MKTADVQAAHGSPSPQKKAAPAAASRLPVSKMNNTGIWRLRWKRSPQNTSPVPGSCGTAEKENNESDYNRSSDINNDGSVEQYDISLWQTTNYYTVDSLSFIPESKDACIAMYDIAQEDDGSGTCMNLWVDKTDYGNITYVLYEKTSMISIFAAISSRLIKYQKLIQTDCHVQTEVTVRKISPDDLP